MLEDLGIAELLEGARVAGEVVPCDGTADDCGWDELLAITEPDGRTRERRIHTHTE